jgi:hypothetical protein
MSSKQKFIQPGKKVKAFKRPDLIIEKKKSSTKENIKKAAIAAGLLGIGAVSGALINKKISKKKEISCPPAPIQYVKEVESLTIKHSIETKKLKTDLIDLKEQNKENDRKLLDEKRIREDLLKKVSDLEQNLKESIMKYNTASSTINTLRGNLEGLRASISNKM